MKKLMFMTIFLLLALGAWAQKTVSGKVTDASGIGLPGVNVVVKGTTIGVATDIDGKWTLSVPNENSVLLFSAIGMKNMEVKASKATSVKLHADAEMLDEVVVTALGITRAEKSLGYAVSKVKGDDLTKVKDPNILSGLSGKVAGVNITQQSGTVGSSSKIIIRGNTSLGGNNQPLFVVDGMPIDNSYYGNGIEGAVDYGNAVADINSMDVENINVLKGSAATALYGARAKNGAIIITTKRGKKGTFSISYNGSLRMDKVAKLPDYQNEYAQGLDGKYLLKNFNGWGPKISEVSNQTFKNFLGQDTKLNAYKNNVRDFFDRGITQIHNFDVNGGDEVSDFRVSYTLTDQQGIIPQSEYKSNNIAFNTGRKLNDWIEARVSGNYTRGLRDGLTAQGSNDPNVIVGSILGMPRTTDVHFLRANTYDKDGMPNSWDGKGKNNIPYFILDNNKITSDNERFYGNINLAFKPLEWLSIRNQTGIDFSTQERRTLYVVGTLGEKDGKFYTNVLRSRVFNNDLIISINKELSSDLKLNALLGHNVYQKEYDRKSNMASELLVPGLYSYANAKTNKPTNYYSMKRIHGVYAEINLDYKDMLYLTLTGRNDWSSTLPEQNNSYFYPSASLGWIFSNSFTMPKWLGFGKLRLNWANVGSDEDPYQLQFEYSPTNTWFSQYGAGGNFPHQGVSGFSIPRTYPNFNLKPQNQVSYEAGLDLRLFQNRVTLDMSYYRIDTEDQIVGIDVPLSTGYFRKKINAGLVRNEGFEIQLGITPVKTTDFEWNTSFNFSHNKNTVEKLYKELKDYTLTSGWSGLQIKAAPGKSFSLFGTGWKRNDKGEVIINKSTGLREVVPNQNLGNIDPDFRLGFVNTFSYKGLTLNAVIDWKKGGHMFSGTAASLRSAGLVVETLAHRGEKFIDTGVNEIIKGKEKTYEVNKTPVKNMQEYWGNLSSTSNTEGNVYDASYMKLRELSLTYSLPKSVIAKMGFVKGITIGIEGRNLWNIIDNVPHIDPELDFFGPSSISGGVEFNSVPMSRTFGFNCKVNF